MIRVWRVLVVVVVAMFALSENAYSEPECELVVVDLGIVHCTDLRKRTREALVDELGKHEECTVVAVDCVWESMFDVSGGYASQRLLYDRDKKYLILLGRSINGNRSWQLTRNIEIENICDSETERERQTDHEWSSQFVRSSLRHRYRGPEGAIVWR